MASGFAPSVDCATALAMVAAFKPKRYGSNGSGHDPNQLESPVRDDGADHDFHKRPLRMAPADRPPIEGPLVRDGNAELDAFDDFAGLERMIRTAIGAIAKHLPDGETLAKIGRDRCVIGHERRGQCGGVRCDAGSEIEGDAIEVVALTRWTGRA